MDKSRFSRIALLLALVPLISSGALAQRTGYSKDEFMRRRAALMDKAGDGLIILFGESMPQPGAHFHQENDFYYLTGVEDPGAALIMVPRTKEALLFLPQQTPREAMMGGANLLKDPKAKAKTGFTEIYDVSYFDEYIGRGLTRGGLTLHLRLSPADTIDNARYETLIFTARKARLHYNDQISLDDYRILKLKERFPAALVKDITPAIDTMRVIKSAEEMEVLRRNGRITAEAVKQAMLASRPSGYEYEVEAAAMSTVLKNGGTGAAYPPIVGSGPNTCILHYEKNDRREEEGDLVLMDFGGLLDYMCMDISRTWPASGKFSDEQKEVYQIVLEVQKACIEAYRPGVTNEEVQKHVAEVMKKKGLDPRGQRGGFGHYVGLCTHDVGPRAEKLEEGMVFAIEPGLYYPEKNIGVRIEDTVLITKDGCEVLTKDVPKEIEEVEKLLSQRSLAASPGAKKPEKQGTKPNSRVRIRTGLGDIQVQIYERQAPITAANFLRYVDGGLFKGASFYRVVRPDNQPHNAVKIAVIQGGLSFSRGENVFPPIEHETTAGTGLRHKDGVISMARDAPGSATSEFFICIGDQPELDFGGKRNSDGQGFAAFGQVVEGMDIVRKIQQQPDEAQALKERVPILDIERIR